MRETQRAARRFASLLSVLLVASLLGGCATRMVRKPIIDRVGVRVDLVREVKGFATQPRGFEHPAIISTERMTHILNAVEVETKGKADRVVRQPAFHPVIVPETAKAIAEALAQAGPDQEVGVKVVRKEMQFGVFHRKFLTSCLAYIKDDHLYLFVSRVDWPIPQKYDDEQLPEPRRDYRPMDFRVVGGEHLFYAGPQVLEIDWRNPVFRTAYRLPASTGGKKQGREILDQSPIPKEELDAASKDDGGIRIDQLTPEQLRALADLEEDRRQGRITETAYQRGKRQLLRPR